jgi:hypothetical protein
VIEGVSEGARLASAWEHFSKPRGVAGPPVAKDTIYNVGICDHQ